MSYETILYDVADSVATLTLNRPDKLNAFNDTMRPEIKEALGRAAADESVRALLITGAGRGFCSGQDLNDRVIIDGRSPRDLGKGLRENYHPLVRLMRDMPKPVVVAVNGVAAGAGCNFALGGDIVIAARSATFLQAFVRIGVIPDCGGTYHLPRLVGRARALGMAMLGEPLSAEQAEAWGLIWKCVDDDRLRAEADAMAARLAAAPTVALKHMKQALQASLENSLEEQLEMEAEANSVCGFSEDYKEGVGAFIEKRAPHYRGR